MSQQKVIAYNRLEAPVLNELYEKFDTTFVPETDPLEDADFLELLKKAEGIIGLDLPVGKKLLDQAPHLKIISNVSVGYNNLDIEAMKQKGVMGSHTPGVLTDTVADSIFGMLVAAARRMPELDHYVKTGRWTSTLESPYYGTNVHHKTLGIIGMGRIGHAIAKRANKGFDMNILYHTRSRKPEAEEEFQATHCTLEELLESSDFVCMMPPLTPETEGMIGMKEFQRMKNSAFFVNGSRGQTIVESDLIEALQTGEIAGAALDVFEEEPTSPDNPLLSVYNVVTLPHIGSSTTETELEMSRLAADNLKAGLKGDKPPNLIDEDMWK